MHLLKIVEKLVANKRLYIISDHSDSRKPYSSKLENLGKVRSLAGSIINGFTTLGSVILDENKKELTNNPTIQMICDLANSKGKITHYFFLEGLKMLLLSWHVQNFRIENSISDALFAEMQAYAGIIE